MIQIIGTGSYLPEKILTNHDLEQMVETSDEWITRRTGIKERRIAGDNETTSDLGTAAARKALEMAKMKPEDIQLILVATSTADYKISACAPLIQTKLGCNKIPAFDINSVCTSYTTALMTGYSMLASGLYENCLIIGADVYSKILNWKDRNTCVIFGDGAGATIIKRDEKQKGVLSHLFGADGTGNHLIQIPVGGTALPQQFYEKYEEEEFYLHMTGKKVYEFTISVVPKSIKELIEKAGLSKDDLDWVILHQANVRIISSISSMLEIDFEKFVVTIDKTGNTSSASIPLALDTAVRDGRIKRGDKVMMVGFGGGLSWGGMILEW